MATARSPERQAEIVVMDKIERAMNAIDALPASGQARVRQWMAETWPYASPTPAVPADGAVPKEATIT